MAGFVLGVPVLFVTEETAGTSQEKRRQSAEGKGGIIFHNISVLSQRNGEVRRKSSELLSPCPKELDVLHSTRGNYAQPLPCNSDTHTYTHFPLSIPPYIYHYLTPSHFLIAAASPTHPQLFFPSCTFLGFLWMLKRSSSCTSH